MNKKLIAPIVTAAAMLATSVGSTFALFSSKASSRIDINAGKLEVKLTKGNARTYSVEANESGDRIDENGYKYSSEETEVPGVFTNGGTATFTDCNLVLDKISPGDRIEFDLNASQGDTNIIYKYRVVLEYTSEDETIGRGMEITTNISGSSKLYKNLKRYQSAWATHDPANPLELNISFDMELPVTCGNEYQEKEGAYSMYIEAVQGNAAVSGEEEIEYFPFNGYGFYDSKEVDGHWVHEITNVAEFRNIVTNEGNIETPDVNYPGYGDSSTVYLIRNDIDFGKSAIWTSDDPINDFVFNGTLEGKTTETTLRGYYLNSSLGTSETMSLFPMARTASFKNLVIDDFVFQNDSGENCGFLVGKTESNNYSADRILRFENILIKDTCSITASKSIGSLMGLARGCLDLEAKNVVNNAEIIGGVNNIAGFISQASAGSVPTGTAGSWRFENCINNGNVIHTGNGNVAGFVTQLEKHITITFKDCESNGKLFVLGTSVAYFTNNATTNVKKVVFEGTQNNVAAIMYTLNGAPAASGKAEEISMNSPEFAGAFKEGSLNNYGNNNEVMNYKALTLSFDESNKLQVAGAGEAEYDYSVLTVVLNGKITVDVPTNEITGEGSKTIYSDRKNNSVDYSYLTKISHIGFCTPSASIPCPVKKPKSVYDLNKFYIEYANMETLGHGTRYDTENGYFVIDNTGMTMNYDAITYNASVNYTVKLYMEDGTFVGSGSFNPGSSALNPFVF